MRKFYSLQFFESNLHSEIGGHSKCSLKLPQSKVKQLMKIQKKWQQALWIKTKSPIEWETRKDKGQSAKGLVTWGWVGIFVGSTNSKFRRKIFDLIPCLKELK